MSVNPVEKNLSTSFRVSWNKLNKNFQNLFFYKYQFEIKHRIINFICIDLLISQI